MMLLHVRRTTTHSVVAKAIPTDKGLVIRGLIPEDGIAPDCSPLLGIEFSSTKELRKAVQIEMKKAADAIKGKDNVLDMIVIDPKIYGDFVNRMTTDMGAIMDNPVSEDAVIAKLAGGGKMYLIHRVEGFADEVIVVPKDKWKWRGPEASDVA